MAYTLGLHIDTTATVPSGGGPGSITAAGVDDELGIRPTDLFRLGESGPAEVCAVGRDAGGAVLVGAAAVAGDPDAVTDPLERAAAGDAGPLTALI
ncbi:MAG: hypothetical protein R2695_00095, partial [Acidimicrobiales bacterium]